MRDITARYYMLSRLQENEITRVHKIEETSGITMRPSEIKSKFKQQPVGDVPEKPLHQPEQQISAIYDRIRAQYQAKHTGCCFRNADGETPRSDALCRPLCGPGHLDIAIIHTTDTEVLSQIASGHIALPFPQTQTKDIWNRMHE